MLHAATAEMLRSGACPPLDQIALHYFRAGEQELARKYALEAADDEPGSPISHMRLLRLAYDASEEPGRRPAAVRLARAHYDLRELAKAKRYGEEALKNARELRPGEQIDVRLVVACARGLLGVDPPAKTLAQLAELENAALEAQEELLAARALDAALEVLEATGDEAEIAELFVRGSGMAAFREPAARCRIMALLAASAVHDRQRPAWIGAAGPWRWSATRSWSRKRCWPVSDGSWRWRPAAFWPPTRAASR